MRTPFSAYHGPSATPPNAGMPFALATDVGGGTSFSLLRTMQEAYKVAQLQGQRLTALRAFYLATLGGARALRLADRAVFLEKGEVRFTGPTKDLLERDDILRAVYLQGSAATEPVAKTSSRAKAAAKKAKLAASHALLENPVVPEPELVQ